MPRAAARPCRHPGCPNVTHQGRFCDEHQREHQQDYETTRPSAAARGYDANWRRLRKMILRRSPLCVDPFGDHAGRPVQATEVDHITPLRAGGTNEMSNLRPLCSHCHSRKTAKEDGGFGNRRPASAHDL